MPKIVITGVPGLDGEYDFDPNFTHRDFRTIKQVAGVRAAEVMDAIEAGDLDVVVAMAEIALRRAERPHSVDDLWDAPAGSVVLDVSDLEEEEPEADPSPSGADEPKSADGSASSGLSTSGATDTFPETFPQLGSGTQQQVSGSVHLTSTT